MTRGVLMYCFDTEQVDYHRVANASVALVKQHLELPITMVTNSHTLQRWVDRPDVDFITVDNECNNTKLGLPWHNLERCQAVGSRVNQPCWHAVAALAHSCHRSG